MNERKSNKDEHEREERRKICLLFRSSSSVIDMNFVCSRKKDTERARAFSREEAFESKTHAVMNVCAQQSAKNGN
jgi:hypothetical protein